MTLALLDGNIRITTSLIGPVLTDLATYKLIEVIGTQNGTKTVSFIKLLPVVPVTGDTATIDSGGVTILPSFFGLTAFTDGVYQFTLKYVKNANGMVVESNCFFLDVALSCSVASTLNGLVEESRDETLEPTSAMIHLLHYGLTNGSNCGCNCEDMVTGFNELKRLLTGVDPKIIEDCGC